MKRALLVLVGLVLALVVVVAVRTALVPSRQIAVQPVPPLAFDELAAGRRLAGALPFRTISSESDPLASDAEFKKLHAYIDAAYPHVRATLQREAIGENGLLYTWKGSDPQAAPIALMAHQDVVPIASGTEAAWQVEPFAGRIQDGFIWGRGAWDDKGNLFSQLEAVEMLIAAGFQPRQTVYLMMGHDEEVLGLRGNKQIAALLKARGVRLAWVLDEGLLVTEGMLPGLDPPAALIGVAEKGYATYQLSLDGASGHSSMPPRETTIGAMSQALARLEDHQMPAAIRDVAAEMFGTLAPEMHGINHVALANLWLLAPLVKKQLEAQPGTDALLRTTTAITIVNAGNKDNVLPGHAEATVNYRLLPGDTIASVAQHVKDALANDRIRVTEAPGNSEASPISPTDSAGYRAIARTVRETFPDAVVAPSLVVGATDSRYMTAVSNDIYKFSPVRATTEDLPRFHGTNERISVKNYAEMIRFYHQLLINASRKDPS